MNFDLLAISVGNTRTRMGAFLEGKLVDERAFTNEDIGRLVDEAEQAHDALRHQPKVHVLAASVNARVYDAFADRLGKRLDEPIRRVERDLPIPIGRQLDPEALVGEDRLLNAAAAFDVLKQACVVIDAGTAMTIDLVDGTGTFHGGAIMPGAQMMLDALTRGTAHLPEVEFNQPIEPVGHNTVEAMLSGVYHGMRGMVREITEQFAERAGAFPMVVATGGNAPRLFSDSDLVERIVPDLTLMGLAVTCRVALEQQS